MASTDLITLASGKQETVVNFVRRTMFKGVPDDVLSLTLIMADRYGLDPIAKHVVVIEFKGKFQPYITRDGLLHVAHESGQFDGITATYATDDIGEYAEATVWRRDMSHPIVYRAYRKEYDTGRYTWSSHPIAMTTKTAEVIALRRAFDVAVTAREEMEAVIEREDGQVIEAEYIPDAEPPTEPPARPKGKGKAAQAEPRYITVDEGKALIEYAHGRGLEGQPILDALQTDKIANFMADDPPVAGRAMIDAYCEGAE